MAGNQIEIRKVPIINPRTIYPGLDEVAILYPGARPDRISPVEYAKTLDLHGRLTPAVEEAVHKAEEILDSTQTPIYIAGGLTGVDEVTKLRYGQVSDLLASYPPIDPQKSQAFFGYVPHLHGTDPVKHPYVTSDEVRDIDYLWASLVAKGHVNFLHPLAHGNAIELGWAERSMIPTTTLNRIDNKLSRLTLGMNNVQKRIDYQDFNTDGLAALRAHFDEYYTWMKRFPRRDPREFHYMSFANLRVPVLQTMGIDHSKFSPNFSVNDFLVYVKNPLHNLHGRVGQLTGHDWREQGEYYVRFPNATSDARFPDDLDELSFWLN